MKKFTSYTATKWLAALDQVELLAAVAVAAEFVVVVVVVPYYLAQALQELT